MMTRSALVGLQLDWTQYRRHRRKSSFRRKARGSRATVPDIACWGRHSRGMSASSGPGWQKAAAPGSTLIAVAPGEGLPVRVRLRPCPQRW